MTVKSVTYSCDARARRLLTVSASIVKRCQAPRPVATGGRSVSVSQRGPLGGSQSSSRQNSRCLANTGSAGIIAAKGNAGATVFRRAGSPQSSTESMVSFDSSSKTTRNDQSSMTLW